MSVKFSAYSLDSRKSNPKMANYCFNGQLKVEKMQERVSTMTYSHLNLPKDKKVFIQNTYKTPVITESQIKNVEHQISKKDIPTVEQKITSASLPSKIQTISPYELALFLASENDFVILNDNLHLYIENLNYYKKVSGEEAEKVLRKLIPSHYRSRINTISINETRKWLEAMDSIVVNTDSVDQKLRKYVNFRNGVLEITSGKKVENGKHLYFTSYINANYPFDTGCSGKYFMKYINDITEGDKEIEFCLQEIIGLVISEIRDLKVAVYFYGMTDSGKSLLIEVMRTIIGEEFCSSVGLLNLSSDQFVIAELYGKKLNTFAEMGEIDLKRLDIFKTLTGNDTCLARRIYGNPFSFRNKALFLLAGNSLPKIKTLDLTNAFFNRLMIIPFLNTISKHDQDLSLREKLLDERSYIVQWGIQGLRRLISNGFVFTKSTLAEKIKREYIQKNNSFQAFIESACELHPDRYTFSFELEQAYGVFCEGNHLTQITSTDLHRILKSVYKLPYRKQSINGSKRNGYYGIELKAEYKALVGE